MTERNNQLQVEIVSMTERDPIRAAALLIFTKHTRLEMSMSGMEEIYQRCKDNGPWMISELDYMAKTIRSSWEFLDVTFLLKNVSRAAAQQITRTRFTPIDGDLFGSYAMQSQRVSDMSSASWHTPAFDADRIQRELDFDNAMRAGMESYKDLVADGMSLEDARGVLPINLHCNLVAKYNLRMLVDLIQARSSYRAQSEFQQIAAEMRAKLVAAWPWASLFLKPRSEIAKNLVDELMDETKAQQRGDAPVDFKKLMTLIAKVDDQLQGNK